MPGDKAFRVFFPEPIILHGSDEKRMVEIALEYLRQPGRIRFESLAPAKPSPLLAALPCYVDEETGKSVHRGGCGECVMVKP